MPTLAERLDAAQEHLQQDLATADLRAFDQRVTAILAKHDAAVERLTAEIERLELWLYDLGAKVDPESAPPVTYADAPESAPADDAGKYRPCRVLYPDGRQRKGSVVSVNIMPPDEAVTALRGE